MEMSMEIAKRAALVAMQQLAQEMGLHGVAMVETTDMIPGDPYWTTTALEVGNHYDPPEVTAGWSPTGATYDGIAFGKIAQTRRTGDEASHTLDPAQTPLGESPWQGCLVLRDEGTNTIFRIAFSGGTEEEDVRIAQAGRDKILVALQYVHVVRNLERVG